MPFRSEKQRRYLWANEPKIAREWTDEYGSKPVKAKVGKYQEFKHPQHDILPLEHMEEKVSSKERVERLLDERKKKKESKKKLAKDGPSYVPGWKPNLSVKAAEGELVRQKTQGTGAAIKGIEHYTMKGMPTAQTGQLIQTPTRGTGAAVKGTDHYVMQGMDAAKTGKMIKAQSSAFISPHTDATALDHTNEVLKIIKKKPSIFGKYKSNEPHKWIGGSGTSTMKGKKVRGSRRRKINKEWLEWKYNININGNKEGKMIKAKDSEFIKRRKTLSLGIHSTATSMYDKPPGWDVKKISDKTHKKLTKVWKHRETGGWSPGAGKKYKKYLTGLKKITGKTSYLQDGTKLRFLPAVKSKSFHFKDATKPSDFLHRRMTLGSMRSIPASTKALAVLKKVGKRTGIGKAVAAATVVAGAYEAGKRKLFTKKDKKKVDKKSIGGETVVMKSGGGYIDELL